MIATGERIGVKWIDAETPVIQAVGELVGWDGLALEETLFDLIGDGADEVAVDLRLVTKIDEFAISALSGGSNAPGRRGRPALDHLRLRPGERRLGPCAPDAAGRGWRDQMAAHRS